MEKGPNEKDSKINLSKTKAFHIGQRTKPASNIDPCTVCGKKKSGLQLNEVC